MSERSPTELSQLVDSWFTENTYRWQDFQDVGKLVRLKEKQRVTVSVVLPTLNEESTIAEVVSSIKSYLVERLRLIDELVVVDSDSTDRTVEIARAHGVRVVKHADILPSAGTHIGKGEALWKSLFLLSGDIIAWCDTDIVDIQASIIFGVLGPLLVKRHLAYVKGFYRRPIAGVDVMDTDGGGRVTELVARPLISLLYPELSGFAQPLAGVCAARRDLLERLPFFTGYGVEIGHLIDSVQHAGLDLLAQADLGTVVHRHRGLHELSQMAFAIEHVMLQRFLQRHGVDGNAALQRTLARIHREPRLNGLRLERREAADAERLPAITVGEYSHPPRAAQ